MSFDRMHFEKLKKNYQIVALTTLWSFLAYEVTQNLILEHLDAKISHKHYSRMKYSIDTDKERFESVITWS